MTSVRPVVAVLAAHWESRSEAGWITRQVAGALAHASEVHVITPDGRRAGPSTDSVFTLHRLATPIEARAEQRRDLVVEAMTASLPPDELEVPTALADWIDRELVEPWGGAARVLTDLRPDLVVIAGHEQVGALAALEAASVDPSLVVLALGDDRPGLGFPHYDRVLRGAQRVLTVTEAERQALLTRLSDPDRVHRIGAPMAANPSVLSEPNTWVGPTDYVVVLTGVGLAAEHEEAELARLIRLRFPDNPVGIVYTDAFDAWHRGRLNRGWAAERSSDLARLMAWARVTVDLHPGRLFARRCVESLLFGTPIVVPAASRAREHAERGGGLWFSNPAELIWCVEALLEDPPNGTFGRQGRAYAEAEYGSTEQFVDRVLGACDLAPGASGVSPVGLTA